MFYTDTLSAFSFAGSTQGQDTLSTSNFLFSCLPVAASVVTLVVLVALESRYGSPVDYRWTFWTMPLCAAIFTPVLLATNDYEPLLWLFILGALGAGVGSGFLWVMWGECFARYSQEDTEFLAPISAILAALITLVVAAMSGWIPVVLTTLLPVASGACLIAEWKELQNARGTQAAGGQPSANRTPAIGTSSQTTERAPQTYSTLAKQTAPFARPSLQRVLSAMGRACFGILAACLFICLEGGFYSAPMAPDIQLALIFSLLFMAVVGFTAISGPRRVSLAFLYRWMCPLMVAGFAAIVFDPTTGVVAAFALGIAARFAFCLITQMYFARYSAQGLATPLQAYGLGWISVHLGDLLGVFAIMYAQAGIESGAVSLSQVAAIAIVLLVTAVMFALGGGKIPFNARGRTAEVALPTNVAKIVGAAASAGHTPSMATGADAETATPTAAPQAAKAAVEASAVAQAATTQQVAASQQAPANPQVAESQQASSLSQIAQAAHLTKRELEVFELLAQGRSVPYIRDALFISRETAATHTKHIYAKLGVHSRQELIDLVRQ